MLDIVAEPHSKVDPRSVDIYVVLPDMLEKKTDNPLMEETERVETNKELPTMVENIVLVTDNDVSARVLPCKVEKAEVEMLVDPEVSVEKNTFGTVRDGITILEAMILLPVSVE